MKKTEELKHTYEFRIEEVLKHLVPDQAATVDYDNAIMRMKDGNTVLVLEIQATRIK